MQRLWEYLGMEREGHKWRKHPDVIHYADYIKSEFWTERKQLYFSTHAKACRVCGSPRVDLHHLQYGSYGHEQDKHLAALCRVHHEALHKWMGVRKNTYYQTVDFIEAERTKFIKTNNQRPAAVSTVRAPANPRYSFANLVDDMARPIWKLLARLGINVSK